ncbi:hypothetical protein PP175_10955 [Aneurinibacillus sp. Ricciae_BoGa-3]|uniref:hypothetical protein n=1 Tax=Aneurinibacillus sp. Ricciae_BoGa-3 TaxID=3022697 RepID=UPI0023421991|nr:hypothetical protein [Aneurinibacillus sp. Ricciae_BoGa-3]WCK56383.1 hypothetical protein PP175_10955 [Aneurinibacillus sp. Ricciae_BoGa-3]
MKKHHGIEVLLWSIALPGFGQILNGKFFKGLLLIGLEFLINVQSHLNEVIISSFHGDISETIANTNYQWLMFYPCIYMFGIWDAYKDAGGGSSPYIAVPFVFGAYFGTIGVIYSRDVLGGIWLGIFGIFVGVGIGLFLLKRIKANRGNP